MVSRNSRGCSCGEGCCGETPATANGKRVVIDFLYLDLSTCTRCQGADNNLDEAVAEVSRLLQATGAEVILNKINVNTEALAIEHRFVSSPTIRVNGRDIQLEVKESSCGCCSDISGTEVDCRTWTHSGVDYDVPPKAMIIEGILSAVYGVNAEPTLDEAYTLPENLRRFYAGVQQQAPKQTESACCSGGARRICC